MKMEKSPVQNEVQFYRKMMARLVTRENLDHVLQSALEAACVDMGTEAGSVLLRDGNDRHLRFAAIVGEAAPKLRSRRIPDDLGIAGSCIQSGRTQISQDVEKDDRFFREFAESIGFRTRNLVAVPLKRNGETLGALELLNWRGRQLPEGKKKRLGVIVKVLEGILSADSASRS